MNDIDIAGSSTDPETSTRYQVKNWLAGELNVPLFTKILS